MAVYKEMKQHRQHDFAMVFFILFITTLGAYLRISQVAQINFPINDGGMFYSMTSDLLKNGFQIPAYATYNNLGIAFAYPPLAFYLAGFLSFLFKWPLIEIFRFLPAIISTLTIPAFYFLANDILNKKGQVALASMVFALMPADFEWLIMGGGISRSLGLLFSILTLWAAYRLYRQLKIKYILATAALGSLAVLSHPEAAIHTAAIALVFFLFLGRNKKGLVFSVVTAILIFAITAPWWFRVVSLHGLGPFLAASHTGGYSLDNFLSFVQLNITNEIFLTFMGCFAVLGLFIELARRKPFLPVWMMIVIISEPRSAPLYITPCLAMFAGIALNDLILPGINSFELGQNFLQAELKSSWAESLLVGRIVKIFFVGLLAYFMMSAFALTYTESRSLVLSESDLKAFDWIEANIPSGNYFAVMTGDSPLVDPTAEWFPALTGQISIGTVQGNEWDPTRDFNSVLNESKDLQLCIFQTTSCFNAWVNRTGHRFDFVYFSKTRIENQVGGIRINIPLEQSLIDSGQYNIIYDTDGVSILMAVQ